MKKILFIFLGFSFVLSSYGQDRLLKGKVTSVANEPLIGANILVVGTGQATVTDLDGHFQLMVKDSILELKVSYTGFELKKVRIEPADKMVDIRLEAAMVLDEIVVETRSSVRKRKRAKGKVARSTFSERSSESLSMAMPAATMAPASISSTAYEGKADFAFADTEPSPAAGQLTAGEVNDFSKWELWQDIAESDLQMYQEHWKINPKDRYAVQLLGEGRKPLVGARVRLMDGREVVWETLTDNTGKAELWSKLFSAEQRKQQLSVQVNAGGQDFNFKQISSFHQGINMLEAPIACDLTDEIDIAFMVDATGSMGDEIQYLQSELADVIRQVKDTLPGSTVRVGSVFYRDQNEEYVTRVSPLLTDISQTLKFINGQAAAGGGDYPEAVEVGLEKALNELDWNPKARARLLFLVLDAPPHQDAATVKKMEELTSLAASKGIRIVPVVASGINKSAEYLFRSIALATNGTYVFLTDDSGIGDAHIKPTTDEFSVEKLNDLLARLVYQFAYAPACEEEIKENDIAALWPEIKPLKDTTPPNWKYYPNPTVGPLFVQWEKETPEEVFLSDFNGKILKRFIPEGSQLEIDLRAYPAGSYLIGFNQSEKWHSERVFRIQS